MTKKKPKHLDPNKNYIDYKDYKELFPRILDWPFFPFVLHFDTFFKKISSSINYSSIIFFLKKTNYSLIWSLQVTIEKKKKNLREKKGQWSYNERPRRFSIFNNNNNN